jgi:hypothetical protein
MNKLKMIIPLVLSVSCSLNSDYFPLLVETPQRVINSFKPYSPGDDYIKEQQTSFITVELGQQNATLVLESIESDIFTWIGQDNVALKTYKGFIINTVGLEHNFEIMNPIFSIDRMLMNNNNTLFYNFDSPRLYELPVSLDYIHQSINMIKLELVSEDINWDLKINVDYGSTGLPSISVQSLHPFTKPAILHFYYKY